MMRTTSIAFAATLLAVTALFGQTDVPSGLSWKSIPAIKARLLMPDGWHFTEKKGPGGAKTYYITKENLADVGSFSTGLMLTVTRHLDRSADEQAKEVVNAFLSSGEVVEPFFSEQFGPTMNAYGGIMSFPPEAGAFTSALSVVANTRKNSLYRFEFRAPNSDWSAAWEIGQWLVGRVNLDDDV